MSVIKQRVVKTRKPHVCHGCAREFPVGSVLSVTVWADGGELSNAYWCAVCSRVWSSGEYYPDDGVGLGELRYEDSEFWLECEAKVKEEAANSTSHNKQRLAITP